MTGVGFEHLALDIAYRRGEKSMIFVNIYAQLAYMLLLFVLTIDT
jgi:hypothetical protein